MGRSTDPAQKVLRRCSWSTPDREAVRAHHRELWERLRDSLTPPNRGGHLSPAEWDQQDLYRKILRRSLLALAEQGWGISETAVMFGVSRPRVQQWCEECGISDAFKALGPGTKPRVWDGQRFVAYNPGHRQKDVLARAAQSRRNAVREARRRLILDIRAYAVELGRSPSMPELGQRFGRHWRNLVLRFRGRSDRDAQRRQRAVPWRSLIRRLYRLAGVPVRAHGKPGHVTKRRGL